MNILVTGANGQLGNEMRIVGRESGHNLFFSDVVGCNTNVYYLDITDIEAVRAFVAEHDIECIVNCAAYTNVDAAEDNEALAELLNARAVENLALVMSEVGRAAVTEASGADGNRAGLLVHISTDYVFGGNKNNTPCREEETENPTGVYGVTKLHGEQAIKMIGGNYVIIRTAWLYSEFGKNFVKTMLDLTASRKELKVVFDQVGTPTYALDLAKAIITVLQDFENERISVRNLEEASNGKGCGICFLQPKVWSKEENLSRQYSKTGTYHFSNEGVCSWFDFTKMIAEYSGQTECNIQPCHSNEFPSKVVRPSYSVLDKTKIKESFGVDVPYWTDSLKQCLQNLGKLK